VGVNGGLVVVNMNERMRDGMGWDKETLAEERSGSCLLKNGRTLAEKKCLNGLSNHLPGFPS
jgi:hypothetical protein